MELIEANRFGDLSSVLMALLHQFINNSMLVTRPHVSCFYPKCITYLVVLCSSFFRKLHGSELLLSWILASLPALWKSFHTSPACPPVISQSQNKQNSHQPVHIVKLTRTYTTSPSTLLSLVLQSKLGKTIILPFSGAHCWLHSNSILLSPRYVPVTP